MLIGQIVQRHIDLALNEALPLPERLNAAHGASATAEVWERHQPCEEAEAAREESGRIIGALWWALYR